MKNMHVAVEQGIRDSVDSSSRPYVGTLENSGVDLAPFNKLDGEIPQELKDKLDELKQQIIDGEIKVG